ncbi:proto-oncogene Mas-like [Strigops habroptila]|uniref:proto-oncogene Mas-like n=1 Tax=Strigops habroptila TaxID=2489341 RepID=UPI0011CFCFFE|nr:proto-oncogene Mas-like [Strigops habroptila]
MDETTTTDLFANDTNSGYENYEGYFEYECEHLFDGIMVFSVVCMGICVFGMLGNGIVLWFLGFQMKRNPFTVYILNLAVADFSQLLLFFLGRLVISSLKISCYDLDTFIRLHMNYLYAFEFLCEFFLLSSLGLLTAISMERCVSVIFPIWYRCHRPKHLSGIVSGVLWASVGAFILSYYLCFLFGQRYYMLFVGVFIVYSAILSLMMLISNVAMVIRLRCCSQRRHLGKLYVAVVLNVIFFFAFGMPFIVNAFFHLSFSNDVVLQNVTLALALLNSSVNPVIYFLVGSCRQRRFRGSINVALRRVFEEKARSEEQGGEPRARGHPDGEQCPTHCRGGGGLSCAPCCNKPHGCGPGK